MISKNSYTRVHIPRSWWVSNRDQTKLLLKTLITTLLSFLRCIMTSTGSMVNTTTKTTKSRRAQLPLLRMKTILLTKFTQQQSSIVSHWLLPNTIFIIISKKLRITPSISSIRKSKNLRFTTKSIKILSLREVLLISQGLTRLNWVSQLSMQS